MTSFDNQRLMAFGWVVHRKVLAAGETYNARVVEDMAPGDSENITLWTRGRIAGVGDGEFQPVDRVPGDFNLDRDLIRAGNFVFTAVEDSEWWCLNWRANRHQLPVVRALRLEAGQHHYFKRGDKVLLCAGKLLQVDHDQALEPGTQLDIISAKVLMGVSNDGPVYGLIFETERGA